MVRVRVCGAGQGVWCGSGCVVRVKVCGAGQGVW